MADETNGRSRISWPTFFAGCGLFITIGVIVVSALTGQWSVQFTGINKQIAHEREVTELKLQINQERAHFETELAKFKKEPPTTVTTTEPIPGK